MVPCISTASAVNRAPEFAVFCLEFPTRGTNLHDFRPITYGQPFRIQHISTYQELCVEIKEEESNPLKRYQISLLHGGPPGSPAADNFLFRFVPPFKLREEGERIRLGDSVVLMSVATGCSIASAPMNALSYARPWPVLSPHRISDIYGRPAPTGRRGKAALDTQYAIVCVRGGARGSAVGRRGAAQPVVATSDAAAIEPILWDVRLYSDIPRPRLASEHHVQLGGNVYGGACCLIFHRELEAFLAAQLPTATAAGGAKVTGSRPSANTLTVQFEPQLIHQATYSVHDLAHKPSHLWVLEPAAPTRGTAVRAFAPYDPPDAVHRRYRLRHLVTGFYLAVVDEAPEGVGVDSGAGRWSARRQLVVISDRDDPRCALGIASVNPVATHLEVNTYSRIQFTASGAWLCAAPDAAVVTATGHGVSAAPLSGQDPSRDERAARARGRGSGHSHEGLASELPPVRAGISHRMRFGDVFAMHPVAKAEVHTVMSVVACVRALETFCLATSAMASSLAALQYTATDSGSADGDLETAVVEHGVPLALPALPTAAAHRSATATAGAGDDTGDPKEGDADLGGEGDQRMVAKGGTWRAADAVQSMTLQSQVTQCNASLAVASRAIEDLICFCVQGRGVGAVDGGVGTTTASMVPVFEGARGRDAFAVVGTPARRNQLVLHQLKVDVVLLKLLNTFKRPSKRYVDFTRLCFRLIGFMAHGGMDLAARFQSHIQSIEECLAGTFSQEAVDALAQIIKDGESIADSFTGINFRVHQFVNFIPSNGRHASYLRLLSSLAPHPRHSSSEQLYARQVLLSHVSAADHAYRLFFATRCVGGTILVKAYDDIPLLASGKGAVNVRHTMQLQPDFREAAERTLGWRPLISWFAGGFDAQREKEVAYFAETLSLFAALCRGGGVVAKAYIATRVSPDEILAGLVLDDHPLADRVRAAYAKLAMALCIADTRDRVQRTFGACTTDGLRRLYWTRLVNAALRSNVAGRGATAAFSPRGLSIQEASRRLMAAQVAARSSAAAPADSPTAASTGTAAPSSPAAAPGSPPGGVRAEASLVDPTRGVHAGLDAAAGDDAAAVEPDERLLNGSHPRLPAAGAAGPRPPALTDLSSTHLGSDAVSPSGNPPADATAARTSLTIGDALMTPVDVTRADLAVPNSPADSPYRGPTSPAQSATPSALSPRWRGLREKLLAAAKASSPAATVTVMASGAPTVLQTAQRNSGVSLPQLLTGPAQVAFEAQLQRIVLQYLSTHTTVNGANAPQNELLKQMLSLGLHFVVTNTITPDDCDALVSHTLSILDPRTDVPSPGARSVFAESDTIQHRVLSAKKVACRVLIALFESHAAQLVPLVRRYRRDERLLGILFETLRYRNSGGFFKEAMRVIFRALSDEAGSKTEQDQEGHTAFANIIRDCLIGGRRRLVIDVLQYLREGRDDAITVAVLKVFTRVLTVAAEMDEEGAEDGGDGVWRVWDMSHIDSHRARMQRALHAVGLTPIMTTLVESKCDNVVQQALVFGIQLLHDGNKVIQDGLMQYFLTLNDEALFSCLQNQLRASLQRVKALAARQNYEASLSHDVGLPVMRGGAAWPSEPRGSTASSILCADDESTVLTHLDSAWGDGGGAVDLKGARKGAGDDEDDDAEHLPSPAENVMRLLQLFCEGHNRSLQDYLREQGDNLHSCDLVKETVLYMKELVTVRQLDRALTGDLFQSFETLTEFCQGPCPGNQQLLVSLGIGVDVSAVLTGAFLPTDRATRERVQTSAIMTCLSLLEGCVEPDIPHSLLSTLEFDVLFKLLRSLYQRSSSDDEAKELGYQITILLETLRPFDHSRIITPFTLTVEFMHFREGIGRIEITREDLLERIYFRVPDVCQNKANLSESTKEEILWKVNRESATTRVQDFLERAEVVIFETIYINQLYAHLRAADTWMARTKYRLLRNHSSWAMARLPVTIAANLLIALSVVADDTPFGYRINWAVALIVRLLALGLSAAHLLEVLYYTATQLPLLVYDRSRRGASALRQRAAMAAAQPSPLALDADNGHVHADASVGTLGLGMAGASTDVRGSLMASMSPLPPGYGSAVLGSWYVPRAQNRRPTSNDTMNDLLASIPTMPSGASPSAAPSTTTIASPISVPSPAVGGVASAQPVVDAPPPSPAPLKPVRRSVTARLQTVGASMLGAVLRTRPMKSVISLLSGSDESPKGTIAFPLEDLIVTALADTTFLWQSTLMVCAWLGFIWSPFFLTLHLMSITGSSPVLQNIIRSITINGKSLILTVVLGVIVVYAFALWAFLMFRDNFNPPADTWPAHEEQASAAAAAAAGATPVATTSYSMYSLLTRFAPMSSSILAFARASVAGDAPPTVVDVGPPPAVHHSAPYPSAPSLAVPDDGAGMGSAHTHVPQCAEAPAGAAGGAPIPTAAAERVAGGDGDGDAFDDGDDGNATTGDGDGAEAAAVPRGHCTSLWSCFVFAVTFGIRSSGLEGAMRDPDEDQHYYHARLLFDMAFYVTTEAILLNIVSGIIIESFAELRERNQRIRDDIRTRCFICGIEANEFDRNADGFAAHIAHDHNMWMYVFFLHHLRDKDHDTFTGQESYVFDCIRRFDLSFFPLNKSLALQTHAHAHGSQGTHREGDAPADHTQHGDRSAPLSVDQHVAVPTAGPSDLQMRFGGDTMPCMIHPVDPDALRVSATARTTASTPRSTVPIETPEMGALRAEFGSLKETVAALVEAVKQKNAADASAPPSRARGGAPPPSAVVRLPNISIADCDLRRILASSQ